MKSQIKNLFKAGMVTVLLFSGYLFIAQAQDAAVTFPIKELGNCGSKQECKVYCDKTENIAACADYAKSHGLMKKEEAEKATKFGQALKKGGPGGCSTAEECKTYCENTDHAEECLSFAQTNGLINAEQVQMLKRFLPLMKDGKTPGGCTDKGSCEAYCKNKDHRQECLDFAIKLGVVTKDDAKKIDAAQGAGPGGCTDKASCQAFCDKTENQQTCLDFAREHGVLRKEDERDLKQGMSNVKIGLSQAPPEVQECLSENLGTSVVAQIENGELTPNSDVAKQIVKCYQAYKAKTKQVIKQKFDANPEVQSCIGQSVGADVLTQLKNGQAPSDPQVAEKIRACFQNSAKPDMREGKDGRPGSTLPSGKNEVLGQKLKECLVQKLGDSAKQQIENKTLDTKSSEVQAAMKSCQQQVGIPSNQSFGPNMPLKQDVPGGGDMVKQCVQQKLGSDRFEALKSGQLSRDDAEVQAILKACGYPMPMPTDDGQNR